MGDLTEDEAANYYIALLLFLQSQDEQKPIRLIISSRWGGPAHLVLPFIDTMGHVSCPVHTFGETVCGNAILILASGERGHRYLKTSSSLQFGNHDSITVANTQEELDYFLHIRKQLAKVLMKNSCLSEEFSSELLNGIRQLSSLEALEAKLVDQVVDAWPPL